MTNDELINRARELAAKATPGPWIYGTDPDQQDDYERMENDLDGLDLKIIVSPGDGSHIMGVWAEGRWTSVDYFEFVEPNARFCAASRELVPALADALDALRAELARVTAERDRMRAELKPAYETIHDLDNARLEIRRLVENLYVVTGNAWRPLPEPPEGGAK